MAYYKKILIYSAIALTAIIYQTCIFTSPLTNPKDLTNNGDGTNNEDGAGNGNGDENGNGNGNIPSTFTLFSNTIQNGIFKDLRNTPHLKWTNVPQGTRYLYIMMENTTNAKAISEDHFAYELSPGFSEVGPGSLKNNGKEIIPHDDQIIETSNSSNIYTITIYTTVEEILPSATTTLKVKQDLANIQTAKAYIQGRY